jgi:hypothetical protein
MRRTRIIVLALLTALLAGSRPGRPASAAEPAGSLQSPADLDPPAIRAEVQNILNDPRFAPRKTVWQWLNERFMSRDLPGLALPDWLKRVIVWTLLGWCVLSLLAILAHFIWTLVVVFGSGRTALRARSAAPLADRLRHRSFEELMTILQELAGRGELRNALGVMMLALLKLLDRAGALRFQDGKTNGEYVREYAPERPGHADVRRFVSQFESTVYGGQSCDLDGYRDMNRLFERIREYAGQ